MFLIGIQKSGTYYRVPLFRNKCPTFVQIKKAGLRAAVLISHSLERLFLRIFRFTRLWYCPLFRTSNTEVHAEYVRTRVYLNWYTRYKIYTSWGHQLLQCLGIKIEFTRFRKAKNKARGIPVKQVLSGPLFWRLFYMSANPTERQCRPPAWIHGRKDTTFFWHDQIKKTAGAIFYSGRV